VSQHRVSKRGTTTQGVKAKDVATQDVITKGVTRTLSQKWVTPHRVTQQIFQKTGCHNKKCLNTG